MRVFWVGLTLFSVLARADVLEIEDISIVHATFPEVTKKPEEIVHALDDADVWFKLVCPARVPGARGKRGRATSLGRSEKIRAVNATGTVAAVPFDPDAVAACAGGVELRLYVKHSHFILFHVGRDQVMGNDTLAAHYPADQLRNQLIVPLGERFAAGALEEDCPPTTFHVGGTLWISRFHGVMESPGRLDIPEKLTASFRLRRSAT